MKTPLKSRRPGSRSRRAGFALIITVSLMVLLTVIVVALLSLSAVSLRAASQGDAASVARSNARLGLMLALGELQAGMGPDRAASARADALSRSPAQPHLVGIWETPDGGVPDGNPSSYYRQKSGQFRQWLVSTPTPQNAENPSYPETSPSQNAIELVPDYNAAAGGSTAVYAEKVPVTTGKGNGSLAWAAFDESMKAAIDLGDPDTLPSGAIEVASRTAPYRFRADTVSNLDALQEPENLISLETAVVPGGSETAEDVRSRFHDFTTSSVGLLTDNRHGGLKRDLTQVFEGNGLPGGFFDSATVYDGVGAPTWQYLQDHYQKYKTLTNAVGGTPAYSPSFSTDLALSRGRGTSVGVDAAPSFERLIPVIAKLQIVFSIVSHHAHIGSRMNFYNTQGVPRGNDQHAIPHLVYEPIITLYNPYDVALDLRNLRIRVWDPPVGFRLQKISSESGAVWYRPDTMGNNQFVGLAQFQIDEERNRDAQRTFTMILSDGTPTRSGTSLNLEPGETKVYSARVEPNWTWGFENQSEWEPRSFFDWGKHRDFGNTDKRPGARLGNLGVEAVPGWDTRAGLQVDHMSYGGRPLETMYAFERPGNQQHQQVGGFVSIRITDQVRVEAKPERMRTSRSIADFQVDIMAGRNPEPTADVVRSYRFNFQNPETELSQYPDNPVIERTFVVGDNLQKPNDRTAGGKKPFAMLEMSARTTRDELNDTKPWLYNNPVVDGMNANTAQAGLAMQSYDIRVREIASFDDISIINGENGFFGANSNANQGATHVPMYRVPVTPAASLGDLIPTNLVSSSELPRVVHPFGNSRAHPLVPTGSVNAGGMLDHSFLLNNTLWDSYYFSSLTSYSDGMISADGRSRRQVMRDLFSGNRPALNSRLTLAGPADPEELANELDGSGATELSRRLASHVAIDGPFNVNSTSVDAWRSVLASLRDRAVTAWGNRPTDNGGRTPVARMGLPLAGSAETEEDAGFDVVGQIRWAGFRALSDGDIDLLAQEIVEQIRLRGEEDGAPPLTLAEFVNRRVGNGVHSLAGILQTAIDESGVNEDFHDGPNGVSKRIGPADIAPIRRQGMQNADAIGGWSGEGTPPILTQGDLMMGLAPVATVRGDTFKIRSYGEATTPDGSRVLARAWCEAVVQRVPEFVDPSDDPETEADDLSSQVNQTFGRRFNVVSFRWLNEDEVTNNGV